MMIKFLVVLYTVYTGYLSMVSTLWIFVLAFGEGIEDY